MPVYILYSNIIWACVASAAAGAGAVFLYFFLTNNSAEEHKSLEDMKPSPKKDLLIGLRDNAEAFAEIYEPLYLLASGRTDKKDQVFAQWNEAVEAVEGYDGFKAAFADRFGDVSKWKGKNGKYASNARKLVKLLAAAGIFRDKNVTVVADENTAEKYILAGGDFIESGVTYDVFSPYWFRRVQVEVPEEELTEGAEETVNVEEAPVQEENQDSFVESIPEDELKEESAEETEEDASVEPIDKKAAKKQAKAEKKAAKAEAKAAKKAAAEAAAEAKAAAAAAATEEIVLCKGIIR